MGKKNVQPFVISDLIVWIFLFFPFLKSKTQFQCDGNGVECDVARR